MCGYVCFRVFWRLEDNLWILVFFLLYGFVLLGLVVSIYFIGREVCVYNRLFGSFLIVILRIKYFNLYLFFFLLEYYIYLFIENMLIFRYDKKVRRN